MEANALDEARGTLLYPCKNAIMLVRDFPLVFDPRDIFACNFNATEEQRP